MCRWAIFCLALNQGLHLIFLPPLIALLPLFLQFSLQDYFRRIVKKLFSSLAPFCSFVVHSSILPTWPFIKTGVQGSVAKHCGISNFQAPSLLQQQVWAI